jgi:hypothetical protein
MKRETFNSVFLQSARRRMRPAGFNRGRARAFIRSSKPSRFGRCYPDRIETGTRKRFAEKVSVINEL